MAKASLVIMAAGIGSRFGGGIKQLEPVGPNGEIIMDYSIYDALEAGFDKVVFVIRKNLEDDFKRIIGNRIEKITEVKYAFQEIEDIPSEFSHLAEERKKPWGTGQAILCCKDVINEPFLVINADDYYGKEAYVKAFAHLTAGTKANAKLGAGMIGFVLKNTLSEFGSVTRGICQLDKNKKLIGVVETKGLEKHGEDAVCKAGGVTVIVDGNLMVSMNMWAFTPQIFSVLEDGFVQFLKECSEDVNGTEYLLPTIVGGLLKEQKIDMTVLETKDRWFGVTYKEDKPLVVEAVQKLVDSEVYPSPLF